MSMGCRHAAKCSICTWHPMAHLWKKSPHRLMSTLITAAWKLKISLQGDDTLTALWKLVSFVCQKAALHSLWLRMKCSGVLMVSVSFNVGNKYTHTIKETGDKLHLPVGISECWFRQKKKKKSFGTGVVSWAALEIHSVWKWDPHRKGGA